MLPLVVHALSNSYVLILSIQHAEEMLLIVKGLTEEGCGPSQATGDEMIRHLWRKKEHLMGELTATREKLKKTMGAENYKALQVCENVSVCVCMSKTVASLIRIVNIMSIYI